jgi:hypothetical protein
MLAKFNDDDDEQEQQQFIQQQVALGRFESEEAVLEKAAMA